MTLDDLIKELLREGYIVKLGEDNYAIANKLKRDTKLFQKPLTPQECISEKIVLSSPSELLKKFIKDSRIPFRAKTSAGAFYQLAAESEYSRKYLYNIMANKQYNYEDMVKVTSAYYNNEKMARVILTNFFKQGVFEQLMEEFKSNPQSSNLGPVTPKNNRTSL